MTSSTTKCCSTAQGANARLREESSFHLMIVPYNVSNCYDAESFLMPKGFDVTSQEHGGYGLLRLLSELLKPLLGRTRSRSRCWAAILSSIVSSSRTVRPCSPWGGRWIGHWRTTGSTVCSSAPHSQATEEAIPHLYKQERKRPTPVRRRLSWTQALPGRVIPGGWVPVSGMKMRSLVGLSVRSAFHW